MGKLETFGTDPSDPPGPTEELNYSPWRTILPGTTTRTYPQTSQTTSECDLRDPIRMCPQCVPSGFAPVNSVVDLWSDHRGRASASRSIHQTRGQRCWCWSAGLIVPSGIQVKVERAPSRHASDRQPEPVMASDAAVMSCGAPERPSAERTARPGWG